MDYESKAFAVCTTTADMREGTSAFLERRKPHFTEPEAVAVFADAGHNYGPCVAPLPTGFSRGRRGISHPPRWPPTSGSPGEQSDRWQTA